MIRPANPFSDDDGSDAEDGHRFPTPASAEPHADFALSPINGHRWPAHDGKGFDLEVRPDGFNVAKVPDLFDFDAPLVPAGGRGVAGGLAGGYRDTGLSLPASLIPGTESGVERAFELAALNALVGVASPLLWLAARLNESLPVEDVLLFRTRVAEEIGRFETNAMAKGISSRSTLVARYALCATIDDIILNTDWGDQSDWAVRGLVSGFYQETWGGERFFDLLGQLHGKPEENIDALELMAVCLSIGFVGKFRVMEGGAAQLTRLRTELYRTLRRVRGPHERALTAAIATIESPYQAPARMAWFWATIGGVLAAMLALYLVLGLVLSWRVDAVADQVAGLAPSLPVLVAVPAIPAPPAAVAGAVTGGVTGAVPGPALTQLQRISAALSDDIANGRVEVARDNKNIVIRLLHVSFPSGGAALGEAETPVLQRVAAALNREPGLIAVIGHTDDSAIANASATRNNVTLSRDRAASAAAILQRFLADPKRASSTGRGDAEPVTSNATPEGKARNRRVEITIPAEDAPR